MTEPIDIEITAMLSLDGPNRSGWYSAIVEVQDGFKKEVLNEASEALKERGFYRPHDNWNDWMKINTTYMRKQAIYYELKVRKRKGGSDE